jgi:NAD(P)-dependent dehydrogenase (short-subunit alcohol dehydrogenase family)
MKDKVVIVTGASRGIGRGLALYLARAGARLVVTGRKPDRLAEISGELDGLGAPHIAVPLDQADRDGAFGLAERTMSEFGRIDGLVANAQTFRSVTPLEEVSASDMDLLLDTGPKGVLWMMQAVFPAMREQGGGRIVTMGSNAALLGAAGYGPYVAAKEAIRGLTRVAAREWGKHGIIVNCACPVSVAHRAPPTDSAERRAVFDAAFKDNPLARDGVIEDDIAPVIAFLLSDGCGYVTGQTLMIDGGAMMRA